MDNLAACALILLIVSPAIILLVVLIARRLGNGCDGKTSPCHS